jgi:hypothetical protein
LQKAYDLRDRASEQEKLYIDSLLQFRFRRPGKGSRAYQAWSQTYPRDEIPYTNLGSIAQVSDATKNLWQKRKRLFA